MTLHSSARQLESRAVQARKAARRMAICSCHFEGGWDFHILLMGWALVAHDAGSLPMVFGFILGLFRITSGWATVAVEQSHATAAGFWRSRPAGELTTMG